jgi:hypothetical protein
MIIDLQYITDNSLVDGAVTFITVDPVKAQKVLDLIEKQLRSLTCPDLYLKLQNIDFCACGNRS